METGADNKKGLKFYLVQLPFIYMLIPIGFAFEFIICIPFYVMCALEGMLEQGRYRRKSHKRKGTTNRAIMINIPGSDK